jgi:hypothetical protein
MHYDQKANTLSCMSSSISLWKFLHELLRMNDFAVQCILLWPFLYSIKVTCANGLIFFVVDNIQLQ